MGMWWAAAALAGSKLLGAGTQIEVSKARNKAIIQQTAKQLNDIALQRAQSRDRTEVSLFNIQQQKLLFFSRQNYASLFYCRKNLGA